MVGLGCWGGEFVLCSDMTRSNVTHFKLHAWHGYPVSHQQVQYGDMELIMLLVCWSSFTGDVVRAGPEGRSMAWRAWQWHFAKGLPASLHLGHAQSWPLFGTVATEFRHL